MVSPKISLGRADSMKKEEFKWFKFPNKGILIMEEKSQEEKTTALKEIRMTKDGEYDRTSRRHSSPETSREIVI